MKFSVNFVERKTGDTQSIEFVFRVIAKELLKLEIESRFEKVPFGNSWLDVFKNLFLFRKTGADIYHITGHVQYMAVLFPAQRTVLTIHDLRILYARTGIRRYIIKKLFLDLPIKRLKYITVVSDATKKDIILHTNCPEEKIHVIENPLRNDFTAEKEKPFDAECPVILQVGTSVMKNLENLARALKGLRCRLRIIGPLRDCDRAELIENGVDFENIENLTDQQLKDEYRNADIVAFCSTHEGFGLPIIEAQATATPLVVSDLSPMKEVAGNGAQLVDPWDPQSIREGIERLLNDPDLRETFVRNGRANIKRFSSSYIAGLYATLYERMLDNE
jgi:glycosyltransferase involved in cell wall biosynthesis